MPVPTTGTFSMFGTANNTIQGAIVEGGGNASEANDFIALRNLATISKFDPVYAGNITSLSQVTSSNQFRGYPTGLRHYLHLRVQTFEIRPCIIQIEQNSLVIAGIGVDTQNCVIVNSTSSPFSLLAQTTTINTYARGADSGNGTNSSFLVEVIRDDDVNVLSITYTSTGNFGMQNSVNFNVESGRTYRIYGTFTENNCNIQ
jgi:hypothetical protein